MKIGFTGTRDGMTQRQADAVRQLLSELLDKNDPRALGRHVRRNVEPEFHHGDCVGADAEADEMADFFGYHIILHPPNKGAKRAFTKHAVAERPPATYHVRNAHIVLETELLIAAPRTEQEELRSGTWMTVRYARAKNIPVWKVFPDGRVELEVVPSEG